MFYLEAELGASYSIVETSFLFYLGAELGASYYGEDTPSLYGQDPAFNALYHQSTGDQSQAAFQPIEICPLCVGVHFSSKPELGRHLKSEHDTAYVAICVECGKGFKSQSGANLHDRRCHGDKSGLDQCQTCGKYFTCLSLLRIHERSHSDARNFLCTTCGKSYKHKKNLQSHVCVPVSSIN